MLMSPHPASELSHLLRLVAVWMTVILLLQGFAALVTRVAGPSHHHQQNAATALLRHSQTHHHDQAERHHHDASDATVVAQAEAAELQNALDAAAAALAAAFALLATGLALRVAGPGSRVWQAARAWSPRVVFVRPPLKPPQGG